MTTPSMSPEQYRRINAIFGEACALDQSEVAEFLDGACAGEPELRAEVEALLASDADGATAIDSAGEGEAGQSGPGGAMGRFVADLVAVAPGIPERIGKYKVIRTIGEGGMGAVYEAEQDHPRRTVAIKVIRGGVILGATIDRFRREADLLGRLQHPGIAHIYDAGIDEVVIPDHPPVRLPFLAMELIEGVPLDEYADLNNLSREDRLALIEKICLAVQHAHDRGIIHRDLKPSNILIESDGQPKVLDFGVARATNADIDTVTLQTDTGQLIGTLPYMSPEQVSGIPDDVDERSDVYALGVLCYELLAGNLPHDVRGQSIPEAARKIREDTATRLGRIDTHFRGDIETIVGKALEKEVARRYQTPSAFASDIHRFLGHEPVSARPPSTIYQLRKFSRRHRGLVAGLVGMFVLLIAGLISTSIYAARAITQRDRAKSQEEIALREVRTKAAINEFLNNDLLASVSPTNTPDPDIRMRAVLDAASKKINGRFPNDPLVEAAVRMTLAETYRRLGEFEEAEVHAGRAMELRRTHLGMGDRETLASICELAIARSEAGQRAEAEAMLVEALEVAEKHFGAESDIARDIHNRLGIVCMQQGQPERAEPHYRAAVAGRGEDVDPTDSAHRLALTNLARLYAQTGRLDQAEPLFEDVVKIEQAVSGEEHPDTISAMRDLARIRRDLGHFDEARALMDRVLELTTRIYGEGDPQTFGILESIAFLNKQQHGLEASLADFQHVLAVTREAFGETHDDTIQRMGNVGIHYLQMGRLADAAPLLEKVLESHKRAYGPESVQTLGASLNCGLVMRFRGESEAAVALYKEVFPTSERVLPERHPLRHIIAREHVWCLVDLGRYDDAEALLVPAIEQFSKMKGPEHIDTVTRIVLLGDARWQRDRTDEAFKNLRDALDLVRKTAGLGHPIAVSAAIRVASALDARGAPADAVALLDDVAPDAADAIEREKLLAIEFHAVHGRVLANADRAADAVDAFQRSHDIAVTAAGPDSIWAMKTARQHCWTPSGTIKTSVRPEPVHGPLRPQHCPWTFL